MRESFTYGSVRGAARKERSLPRLSNWNSTGEPDNEFTMRMSQRGIEHPTARSQAALSLRRSAFNTSRTRTPRRARMSISASVLNRSIRPRRRSLTRGWVMRSIFANSAWVRCLDSMTFCTLISKSARTSRCSASPPEKPTSRKTLPVDRVIFSFIYVLPFSELFTASILDQCAETLPCKIGIPFGSLCRALFEGVQNIDSFSEFRQIEHSVFEPRVNADFLHADAHSGHRLPIIRLKPLLDTTQLKSRDPARVIGKFSKCAARRGEPNQRLIHAAQYAGISIPCQIGLRSSLRGWFQADATRCREMSW